MGETRYLRGSLAIEEYIDRLAGGNIDPGLESIIKDKIFHNVKIFDAPFANNDIVHLSTGSEGGSKKVKNIRVKKLSPERAQECSYINDVVMNAFPAYVVFATHVVGKGSDGVMTGFLVSKNFDGERLIYISYDGIRVFEVKAPLDIMRKHLSISNVLSRDLRPSIAYTKEDYEKKISEIITALQEAYGSALMAGSLEKFRSLIPEYIAHANTPFWDRSPKNAKYDLNGHLKQMPDWSKVHYLVIPAYEAVQIAYSYGVAVDDFKHQSRAELGIENFDHFWELGRLYFLTRQLMHAKKRHDTFYIQKFESLIDAEPISILPNGTLFNNAKIKP